MEIGPYKDIDTNDGNIIRLVETIFSLALQMGASDIHIEPLKDASRVRVRRDGSLVELCSLPAIRHNGSGVTAAYSTYVVIPVTEGHTYRLLVWGDLPNCQWEAYIGDISTQKVSYLCSYGWPDVSGIMNIATNIVFSYSSSINNLNVDENFVSSSRFRNFGA